MHKKKRKFRITMLLVLSATACGVGGWGYWHFIEAPKYQYLLNATRL